MKIAFLFMGKTEDPWVREGFGIYLQRLKHYCTIEVIEIPALKKKGEMSREEELKKESELLLTQLQSGDRLILLDDKGKEMTSGELGAWMNKQQLSGVKRLVIAVGGAFGFHSSVYDRSDGKISLSKLTFTHQMVRVIVAEQVYRAFTILKGEKYHHD